MYFLLLKKPRIHRECLLSCLSACSFCFKYLCDCLSKKKKKYLCDFLSKSLCCKFKSKSKNKKEQ